MNFKRLAIYLLAFALIAESGVYWIYRHYRVDDTADIPSFARQPRDNNLLPSESAENDNQTSSQANSNTSAPVYLNLQVPFTVQAPTGNWDELHNESCEEASAIMAEEYFSGNKKPQLDPQFVESQIADLTKWEKDNYGHYLDTTATETAKMIERVYGLKAKLLNNFSETDLKNELAQNHLVIISENGQKLGNPYYKQPGPIHHMLVIRGFNGGYFITNDPGTKRGQSYLYSFNTIKSAAADWDQSKQTVDQNQKVAIAVWK
ncbi:MAG: C39 family peptidase [Patescibacteria group bacterium]|nr:C39 family peptidase [Patescibacteria group bacterium]